MRRRIFLALLGSAAGWPVMVRAQQKAPVVGVLDFFPSSVSMDFRNPFIAGLGEFGYADGKNIQVEYRSAEQSRDRAAALAAEFVQRQVDVIVALATPAAHAAKNATTTIPIVMTVADPVSTGLVASLSRPGGNLTGLSTTSADLAGKRLELLREFVPGLQRVAFLGAANDPNTKTFIQATETAAGSIGIRLVPVIVTRPDEFDAAFATMSREKVEGLIVQPLFAGHRDQLTKLALRHRLPLIADQNQFATSGGLVSYGIDRSHFFRRAAYYVDKVLKGAKPADLPIEQPTKFQLVINLRTAKALGITVSPTLLARADDLIE